jgi:hypothetical protein
MSDERWAMSDGRWAMDGGTDDGFLEVGNWELEVNSF